MSTLLMRLAAPLQSWGLDSKFEQRHTGRTPSKSAVIGLCAAALGCRRDDESRLEDLSKLRLGIRIDRPGELLKELHMVHEESFWDPVERSKLNRTLTQEKKNKASYMTNRYYLTDAAFLVGLEGEESTLRDIERALLSPMFPLYLGRRGCPPEGHVCLGIVSDTLQAALEKQPPIAQPLQSRSRSSYIPRIVLDAVLGAEKELPKGSYPLRDVPMSFNPEHRKYDFRNVVEYDAKTAAVEREHDALAAVEEVTPCT